MACFLKKFDFDTYISFFKKCYDSPEVYKRRLAYVLGLKHYKNKDILEILKYIRKDEDYMVMMASAWLLATIAINYPTDVFLYLENLDDIRLKRKTISKICDSRRITSDWKEKFKKLR